MTSDFPAGPPGARWVHLVDDDPLARAAVAVSLGAAGHAVTEHDSGSDFLAQFEGLPQGCVLLDIHMPGLDGIAVLEALQQRGSLWPVVVLTGRHEIRLAVEAMKRGAFEFLNKPFTPEDLLRVLDDAFERLSEVAENEARSQEARALIGGLSGRELQVLQGLMGGLPNKLIAYELDLSVRTVELYRGKVMDKLRVKALSSAVRLALEAGIAPLEGRG